MGNIRRFQHPRTVWGGRIAIIPRGIYIAGADDMDADVMWQHLQSQTTAEGYDSRLCSAIGTALSERDLAGIGGDVDNSTSLLLHHNGQDLSATKKGPFDVNVEDFVPLPGLEIHHRTPMSYPSIVDQNVHAAKLP